MPGNLFEKITIESTTVRVGEFDSYTATVNAAEAFSKCILTKNKKQVVGLINQTTGKNFKVTDFTGEVRIGLLLLSIDTMAFKVTFELSEDAKKKKPLASPADITLITKTEKAGKGFCQKGSNLSKEIFNSDGSLFSGSEFEYRGTTYFIE